MSFIRRFWAQRMGAIIAEAGVSQYVETLQFELYPPVPAVGTGAALAAATQPGSQIWFVDPVDGVDPPQAVCYLHDGAKLIDTAGNANNPVTGLPYGTDWLNPGAGIVAAKHWSAVGPTRMGIAPGVRSGGDAGTHPGGTQFNQSGYRPGYPDHWYIKRGTTLDLAADLVGYKALCPGWLAGSVNLSVPGIAQGGTGRQVVGSYGPANVAPANITDPQGWSIAYRVGSAQWPTWDRATYQDLWIDGRARGVRYNPVAEGGTANAGSSSFGASGSSTVGTVRFQGLLFDGAPQFGSTGDARCTFEVVECDNIDSYSLTNNNNSALDAHGNESLGLISVNKTLLAQGGFRFDPRRVRDGWATLPAYVLGQAYPWGSIVTTTLNGVVTAWHCDISAPAGGSLSSTQPVTGNPYWTRCGIGTASVGIPISDTVRDRNCYFAAPGEFNDSLSICGGSGFQFRTGAKMRNSFFFEGYVLAAMLRASGGGWPDGSAPVNYVKDCTVLNFSPGTSSHPGWGMRVGGGASDTEIDGLLVTGAHHPLQNAIGFESVGLETSSFMYARPVRRTRIKNSVLDTSAGACVLAIDGALISAHNANSAYGTVYSPNTPNNALGLVRVGNFPVTVGYKCIQPVAKNSGIPYTDTAYWEQVTPATADVAGYSGASAPGLVDNTIDASCTIISTLPRVNQVAYIQQWGAPATAGVTIDADAPLYTNRAAYAAATPGAVDTERTLRTYLQTVMGWTITSPDGVKELCDYITGRTTGQPQHRGNRDARLSAAAIGGYIRGGWGL